MNLNNTQVNQKFNQGENEQRAMCNKDTGERNEDTGECAKITAFLYAYMQAELLGVMLVLVAMLANLLTELKPITTKI